MVILQQRKFSLDVIYLKNLTINLVGFFFIPLLENNHIMKVAVEFFCIKEKRTYKIGDEYKGKRKDLSAFMEKEKMTKVFEVADKPKRRKKK